MKNKKTIISIIVIVLVLLAGGVSYALYKQQHPGHYVTSGDSKQKGTTKKTTSVGDNKTTKSDTTDTSGTVQLAKPSTPSTNDTYPVTTLDYKIEQVGDKQFRITLYAIINSPSQYNDYQAQLKQYKKEALDYLTNRYGDISDFTFYWNPPNAKDL